MVFRPNTDFETPSNRAAETNSYADADGLNATTGAGEGDGDFNWLQLSQEAYEQSTTWLDANVRKDWARDLKGFNGQHPDGSKYLSEDYKHRSKLYRPKTRATIRKRTASAASAFFATSDVVNVKANDDNDPMQQAAAVVGQELLNHRCDGKPIKWLHTVLGGWTVCETQGLAVAHVYWRYKERPGTKLEPVFDELGQPVLDESGQPTFTTFPEIITDEPRIDLVPPENFRFDPGADWTDPVETSPYLIREWPMYVGDVEDRMNRADPKTGMPQWTPLTRGQILQASEKQHDSTRQAREGNREDSKDGTETSQRAYEIVWAREYIVRRDDKDFHFWTLGDQFLLTEPRPLEEVYAHGRRCYIVGFNMIEPFKTYPASMARLTRDLQTEINEVVNSRQDNLRMVLSPRPKVKLGAAVDLKNLSRWLPGVPIGINTSVKDVEWDRPPDVTGSAYAEQDRLDVTFDDVAGSFSTSSVQSNRQLNETVGGMNLISSSANAVADLDLRVFAETFVEPILRALLELERRYETDEVILTLAQNKAQSFVGYGMSPDIDRLLEQELLVKVNVGIGSTDPQQKIERFGLAMDMVAKHFGPTALKRAKFDEVVSEVFGILGYEDGSRFFNAEDDAQYATLSQQLQEAQQLLQSKQMELQAQAERNSEDNRTRIEVERLAGMRSLIEKMLAFQGDLEMERVRDASATAQSVLGSQARLAEQDRAAGHRMQERQVAGEQDMARERMRSQSAAGLEQFRHAARLGSQGGGGGVQ